MECLTFSVAVGVDGVVSEADLVAFSRCIHNKVCQGRKRFTFSVHVSPVSLRCVCVTIVEVKQEAAHVFVVNLPSAISFILRDDLENQGNNEEMSHPIRRQRAADPAHLSAVLRDEVVLLHRLFDEDAPSCYVRGS